MSFKLFVPLSQAKKEELVFASVILAVFFLVKFDLPWRRAEFRHNDSYKIYDSYTNGFFPKKNLIQMSDISIYEKSGVGMWRFHLNHRFIDQHAKH